MTHIAELGFWTCVVTLGYHYFGYPLLLFVLNVLHQAKSDLIYLRTRLSRRCVPNEYVPHVAVLISAYNEAAVIQAKLMNCLQLDYPQDRLEFFVGLDAPTDATAALASQVRADNLQLLHFNTRRGKLAVVCDLVRRTSAEILVFTDANTILERSCIRNIVRHFTDNRVGAVTGEEIRTASPGTDPGAESIYWRYESAIKVMESRLNCLLGGNGAALAVRRSLFPLAEHSIVEDFQIPLDIRFRGFRVIYDPEVIAFEEIAPTLSSQFKRRVRIGAGNYQTLFQHPRYLHPKYGLIAFCFFSHRLLRWLGPLLLVAALLFSITLAANIEFFMCSVAQCIFYSAAAAAYTLKRLGKSPRCLSVPFNFCAMNLALLLGLFAYLTGQQNLTWQSTPRQFNPVLLEAGSSSAGYEDREVAA